MKRNLGRGGDCSGVPGGSASGGGGGGSGWELACEPEATGYINEEKKFQVFPDRNWTVVISQYIRLLKLGESNSQSSPGVFGW